MPLQQDAKFVVGGVSFTVVVVAASRWAVVVWGAVVLVRDTHDRELNLLLAEAAVRNHSMR